jgi:hypothetical protein
MYIDNIIINELLLILSNRYNVGLHCSNSNFESRTAKPMFKPEYSYYTE